MNSHVFFSFNLLKQPIRYFEISGASKIRQDELDPERFFKMVEDDKDGEKTNC